MTNREIAERVFAYIESCGFKPYDIQYGNTYFIMTGEDDSIIHFRVKGVNKHWKFGMWVHAEYLEDENAKPDWNVVSLFTQWDTQIDKFKPSRSDVLVELTKSDFKYYNEDRMLFCDIKAMLKMLKRHPLMCYAGQCGNNAGYFSDSFLWYFIKYEGYDIKVKMKKLLYTAIFLPICKAKVKIANMYKCVDLCEIYKYSDRNPGWETSYIYEIQCRFKENATDDEIFKVARLFKKRSYGNYWGYDYVAELWGLAQVGRDGLFFIDYERGDE